MLTYADACGRMPYTGAQRRARLPFDAPAHTLCRTGSFFIYIFLFFLFNYIRARLPLDAPAHTLCRTGSFLFIFFISF
jgi:hypothetical protein